ncbi:MAG: 4Fe-4S dicluster domain-containing protein [Planctomycetes bacterium]|nr:4Fe-4S dicluster domain-containing protein [Planctomycetota bacterium]
MNKVNRKIIVIDEDLCNGCGDCLISCPEQALQLVDTPNGKKARIVKEFYCDGLGACIGNCPLGALTIEERVVEQYDEAATIERIKEVAPEMLNEHLKHMEEHADELEDDVIKISTAERENQIAKGENTQDISCGCPGSKMMHFERSDLESTSNAVRINSELKQWPVQLNLVHPSAPYFKNANLLLVADCLPFAYPNFHQDYMKDNTTAIAIGCPKFDDNSAYIEKISQIIKNSELNSITVLHMEVPCCSGLIMIAIEAVKNSGINLPLKTVQISIKGDLMQEKQLN